MSSNRDFAIQVKSVSKTYQIFEQPVDRLKQLFWPTDKKFYREFSALSDISFSINRGETVGIIGRNGSGKSTLLQLICKTLHPSSGTITLNGRVAALLELGAGFNPEFTGRENVFLNATILGLDKKEIDSCFDSIAEFAGLGDFIEQPVKTYSSGMYVRLAFATAINVDPDILIIDEALSVGDEAFQRKCFARIEQIQERGGTILFVSHSASSILQLCSRAILLDSGEKILEGRPKFVVNQYQRLMNLSGDSAELARSEIKQISVVTAMSEEIGEQKNDETKNSINQVEPETSLEFFDPNLVSQSLVSYEQKGAYIRDLCILNSRGNKVNTLLMGRKYTYQYHVDFTADAENVAFGMLIKTVNGVELSGVTTTFKKDLPLKHVRKNETVRLSFEFNCNLMPGTYFVNAGVVHEIDHERNFMHRVLDGLIFQVTSEIELEAVGLVDLHTQSPRVDFVDT